MKYKSAITAERVRELLDYDRVTGAFRWRFDHKLLNLGRFETAEEAHVCYAAVSKSIFGEFARAA